MQAYIYSMTPLQKLDHSLEGENEDEENETSPSLSAIRPQMLRCSLICKTSDMAQPSPVLCFKSYYNKSDEIITR